MAKEYTIVVEAYAWDSDTRDWTYRVTYVARNRMDALRWMNFNREWFKNMRILDE